MFNFDVNILFWSAIVFVAIMAQVLFGTVRVIFMVKGQKTVAILIGFLEATIGLTNIILVISNAIKSGINIFIILFYSTGFYAGLLLGMIISQKISRDILSINIITKNHDTEMEDLLRSHGFGVTCYEGSGMEGIIRVLYVVCKKNSLVKLKTLVKSLDSSAMLTSHTIEGLSGGFLFDIKSRI
ncbi:MAG: DUF2179 domain-containing protein [Actinobacteria bacterium]|nr:DUF2179 domain-containing protein [Actinomycetota bacterium]